MAKNQSFRFGAAKAKRNVILLLAFILTVSSADAQGKTQIAKAYSRLPLSFEPNVGQTDARVNFLARGNGCTLLLTPTGTIISLTRSKMSIHLVRGNRAALPEGLDPLPGKSNYLLGNDRAEWRTNVSNYAKVRYRNVYRGFDVQITEPRGKGVMVAVLSDKPLTSFDTPQAPKTFASPEEGVKVVQRLRDELARSLSLQPKSSTAAPWSVAYHGYTIQ